MSCNLLTSLGLAAQAHSRAAAMRQSKESYSRTVTVVREKSDLGSSRKLERRNEAASRSPHERLGSLSRAVSVDAYTEGQRKTHFDLEVWTNLPFRVLQEIRGCMLRSLCN